MSLYNACTSGEEPDRRDSNGWFWRRSRAFSPIIWYSGTLPARERDDIGNFKGDLVAESLESEKKRGHRRKEKSDGSQCFDAISPVLVELQPAL